MTALNAVTVSVMYEFLTASLTFPRSRIDTSRVRVLSVILIYILIVVYLTHSHHARIRTSS